MIAQGIGQSDVGRRRQRNEDAFLVDNQLGLFAVADGMGGHEAGDVASQLAIKVLSETVRSGHDEAMRSGTEGLQGLLDLAVRSACRAVYQAGLPNARRMGCTMTALLLHGSQAVMAHVGDSRLYLLRDQVAIQLSSDHSVAQELVHAGLITQDQVSGHHLEHMLSRAVGLESDVDPDLRVIDLSAGDRFVLCTDGLTNYVPQPAWLVGHLDTTGDAAPMSLIAFANESGGHDNITVVIVSVGREQQHLCAGSEYEVHAGRWSQDTMVSAASMY